MMVEHIPECSIDVIFSGARGQSGPLHDYVEVRRDLAHERDYFPTSDRGCN